MTDTAPRRRLRCAVYTRKSSEEGLDMEFNSLDAQRESCEAYVASQRAEGWVLVPDRYDDGGNLASRSIPGTVIKDAKTAGEAALRMVRDGEIVAMSGKILKVKVDTLCVHGDEATGVAVALRGIEFAGADLGLAVGDVRRIELAGLEGVDVMLTNFNLAEDHMRAQFIAIEVMQHLDLQ